MSRVAESDLLVTKCTHFTFEEYLGGYLPILGVLRLSLNLGLKAGSP